MSHLGLPKSIKKKEKCSFFALIRKNVVKCLRNTKVCSTFATS